MRKNAIRIMLAVFGLCLVLCCVASFVIVVQAGSMTNQRCPGEQTWMDGFFRRANVSLRWILLREEVECGGCVCVG